MEDTTNPNPAQDAAQGATPPTEPAQDADTAQVETPDTTAPDADVQETEGEEIADTDPKALAKFKRREQRLRRERNDARTELDRLRAEQASVVASERAKMDEETKKRVETLEGENTGLKSQLESIRLQSTLTGKVADPEAAVTLMGSGFRKEDGTPDVDGLLAKYPFLAPGAATVTAPDGGGATQSGTTKAEAIQKTEADLKAAMSSGNRALAASLEAKLTELRKG